MPFDHANDVEDANGVVVAAADEDVYAAKDAAINEAKDAAQPSIEFAVAVVDVERRIVAAETMKLKMMIVVVAEPTLPPFWSLFWNVVLGEL